MPATAPSHPSAGWGFSGRQDSLRGESPLFTFDDLAYFEAASARATSPTEAAEWTKIIANTRAYVEAYASP